MEFFYSKSVRHKFDKEKKIMYGVWYGDDEYNFSFLNVIHFLGAENMRTLA